MWMKYIVVFVLSAAVVCLVVHCRPTGGALIRTTPPNLLTTFRKTTSIDVGLRRSTPGKRTTTSKIAPPLDNPCTGVACSGGTCAVDKDQKPVCVCLNECWDGYYAPVCGSDNRTYNNDCLLQTQSCISELVFNTTITVRNYGICPPKTACDNFFCPKGKTCRIDPQLNRAVCVCELSCPGGLNTVCGSDNVTYGSVCELEYQACENGINITAAYQGKCIPATVCDGHNCSSGRHCAVVEDGQPVCVCNTACSDNLTALVCGSDGTTYINLCHLQMTACLSGVTINVSHSGYCYEGSVCDGFECPTSRLCAVDKNNQPTCVCRQQNCDTNYVPVCGSDGQTYTNECVLQLTACTPEANLTLAYTGICRTDRCWGVVCPAGMHCEVDGENNTRCVCPSSCSNSFSPVCGFDNKTYDNECEMRVAACNAGANVTNFLSGICPSEKMGCEQFRCPSDKHCEVDAENRPSCVCNKICDDYYYPVCGSDNRTYINECEGRRFACMTNGSAIFYNHACGLLPWTQFPPYWYACIPINCSFGLHCEYDSGNTSCVCDKFCPEVYAPVCGNDNRTYDSNCHLRMKACRNQTTATGISHQGTCEYGSGCEKLSCSRDKHCEVDENNKHVCVCNKICPAYYEPLCGSDNKTYSNDCDMQRAGCLTNTGISPAFPGTCDKGPGCYSVICGSGRTCIVDENNRPHCVCSEQCYDWSEDTYVCGTDNKTYAAVCLLTLAACLQNRNIAVLRSGKCPVETPCTRFQCPTGKLCAVDEQRLPTCVCNEECSNSESLVCGSDYKTYFNLCELQKQSCMSNNNVTILHNGNCYENSLCYGVSCPQNTVCAVTDNGPICVCDQCPSSSPSDTVCGSDGVTYPSQCELQRSNCLTGTNITPTTDWRCPLASSCKGVVCSSLRECAVDEENNPICVCSRTTCESLSYYYSPVCSSDGITYKNICEFKVATCFASSNASVAYSGLCT